MYSKVFTVLAVAALAGANDLLEGHNDTAGLTPVFKEQFSAVWGWKRPAKDVLVKVNGLITAINVTDLRDGKDGVASIESGGVGHKHVNISLTSAVLKGYDFMVEVFADEKQIQRGNRDIPEAEKYHIKTPVSVTTSTTGQPEVSSAPTVNVTSVTTPTSKPGVTGVPTSTTEVTGLPTDQPEIPQEPQVQKKVKIGYYPSTENEFFVSTTEHAALKN